MDEGLAAGARARQLALLLGIGLTTLQRWRRQFAGDGGGVDCRKGSQRNVSHRPRFQESCHPSDQYIRGLEDMTNAPLQRGRQG